MTYSLFPSAPPSAQSASAAPPPPVFRSTGDLQKLISPQFLSPEARLKPVPTNEWWGNLLAWDGQRDSDAVFAGPYTYKVVQSQPAASPSAIWCSTGRTGPLTTTEPSLLLLPTDYQELDLLSCRAGGTIGCTTLTIQAWDDMGVHLSMAGMRMYLVLGSAFTTVEYQDMQVQLGTEHCIVAINGAPAREGHQVNGISFVISLNNDSNGCSTFSPMLVGTPHWCSRTTSSRPPPSSPVLSKRPLCRRVLASGRAQDPTTLHASAGVYPKGAAIQTLNSDSFVFNWQLASAAGSNPGARFLHFALTHLKGMLDQSTVEAKQELVLHSHTHGPLFAYMLTSPPKSSPTWLCHVPQAESQGVETCTAFYPPRAGSLTRDLVDRLNLCRVVTDEIYGDWSLPHEGSYYFKGKALQKFGTMCLVARQLADTTNPEMRDVAQHGICKLQQLLSQFADNQSAFPLVYDTVYKGIISSEALAKNDMNVDFGNGVYNDHHYHYGYIVTAAAMALYLDPNWRHSPDAVKLRTVVDTLIRDVATSSPMGSDPYFPRFRYFNWWLGHSYSHGVTPMADGKDEESTSEEVNFLYGIALYGQVTENAEQQALAKLTLKVYVRAVNTYFLLRNDVPAIHPAGFAKNKVTGVFFDNKCDYTTWFSPNKECIHGIQMIPVSPILEVSRPPRFVREEWDEVLSRLPIVHDWRANQSGWTSLLFANYSVLDREKAFEVLSTCPMDDGLSRAWALYYAATRPPPSC
ncbi:Endo-1,3(4)-beta-glucanase [Phytophthora cactorum]|nr:Endo-1,3(4)-beta-glucanase [Phytophthora cactorum]